MSQSQSQSQSTTSSDSTLKFQKSPVLSINPQRKSKLRSSMQSPLIHPISSFQYTIYFHWEEALFEYIIYLPKSANFDELIKKTLKSSNQSEQFHSEEDYEIYEAKKNGNPKEDLPSLDKDQIVLESGLQRFAIKKKEHLKQVLPEDSNTIIAKADSFILRSHYSNQLDTFLKRSIKDKEIIRTKGGILSCFFC